MSKLDPAIDLRVNCLKEHLDKLTDIFNKFEHTPGTGEWGEDVKELLRAMQSDLGFLVALCIPGATLTYLESSPNSPFNRQ